MSTLSMQRVRGMAALVVCAAWSSLCLGSAPSEPDETLLLQDPAVSRNHVVFSYAQDLWVTGRSGGAARRLTSHVGGEGSPRISPDGRWVAFSGQYDGNVDVYVIAIEGGAPRRLTWHPGPDQVCDWHPDGDRILFTSRRSSLEPVRRLHLVQAEGGTPVALPIPRAVHASYKSDGSRLAYTPYRDPFRSWKRYRGGLVPEIWVYDPETLGVEVVPHVNASDTFPCWVGDDLYFASDRDNHMNLWRFRPGSAQATQVTHFDDFDIRNVSAGAGVVVFEQAGAIHVYDPAKQKTRRLKVQVRADGLAARAEWKSVEGFVRGASIAPNGKRAVFEARGEIVTVPKENGDARNITNTPGAHDRSPVWSPDGTQVAWFCDESGEYQLMVRDRLGREECKSYELNGGGFYSAPAWSPDGKHLLFTDKTNRLAYLTFETGEVTEIARVDGSLGEVRPTAVWSPDSRWIALEMRNATTMYDRIALFEVESGKLTGITDAFGNAGEPAFSRDGKHLFFAASVDSGPNLFGLDMTSSAARPPRANLYVAVLSREDPNPLAPRSDEAVKTDPEEDADQEEGDSKEGSKGESKEDPDEKDPGEEETEKCDVDLSGLDQRILALPLASGNYRNLNCVDGKLLFVEVPASGEPELKSFDFEEREAKSLVPGVVGFSVSHDGKSLLLRDRSGFAITKADGSDKQSLAINSVKVRVDPAQEWQQTLREVWRIERDYFYDPNMHGVDWDAMWERWQPFVEHVRHRADLNVVIGELIGELCCGHNYVGGGDQPRVPSGVSVGLLGADLEVTQDRFRFQRIYRGQNWNTGLRAPLTEPAVDVKEGDYLIAVNGREVRASDNLFAAFENTAGRQVDLEVSANADGSASRTSTVVPIRNDSGLRRQAWVEGNRQRVEELSKGRLGYIYMPNTAGAGMASFDRDFYSQLDKEGLVIDERFNGGGQVADYVISVLNREVMCYWMNRESWCARSPFGTMPGPKVMIINESAGSGGDWMPWMFKRTKVGPLVGRRTWGGLVGISGYPPLMDGGFVSAASFGVMDTDGNWAVENEGVTPDHEVSQWPREVIAGGDPQLEKAVSVALEALENNPSKPMPTYTPPSAR